MRQGMVKANRFPFVVRVQAFERSPCRLLGLAWNTLTFAPSIAQPLAFAFTFVTLAFASLAFEKGLIPSAFTGLLL